MTKITYNTYYLLCISFCSTTFSTFFSTIFLIIFIKKVDVRNLLASKLILLLSINDILNWGQVWVYDLYLLIKDRDIEIIGEIPCEIIGFFNNFTCILTIIITSSICFMVYLTTVLEKFVKYNFTVILFGIMIISVLLSCLPFINNNYGRTNGISCWIKTKENAFYSYYLILYFMFVLQFYFILHSLKSINKKPYDENFKKSMKIYLIFFPMCILIAWFPGLLQNLINIITENENIFGLDVLDYCFEPLIGVFNPLIYMMINKEVKNYVKTKIFDFYYLLICKKNEKIEDCILTDNERLSSLNFDV